MLHPIYFLPTLYTDTDMSIFGMVIVLTFQICILLMGFTALFSKGTQQYESWHEFPIDLLYKDVSSLDTKWRILASCPNSQYIGTLVMTLNSLCQRLGLTRSVRNKPRAQSASIERRRQESPPEVKDERSESFTGGARGFAKFAFTSSTWGC